VIFLIDCSPSPSVIAPPWPCPAAPMPWWGARSTEQVLENAAAAELRLSTKDLAEINHILADGGKDIR